MKHPLLKGKPLQDVEMLEEKIYEIVFQEDPNEVSHVEDLDETLEDKFVHPCEEVIKSNDTLNSWRIPQIQLKIILMILCVWKHERNINFFGFNKDPIYDIEGRFQI
jgi:hypothetical protein